MSPPYTKAQWQTILANAHKKLVADPTNPRWRQAMHDAVDAIGVESALPAEAPGVAESALLGAGEGASSGLASRLGDLLPGPSNRAALAAARETHPVAALGGDALGGLLQTILLSRLPGVRAMSAAGQGLAVGGASGAARGAVENPLGNRVASAVAGGLIPAVGGYAAGKVAGWMGPNLRAALADLRPGATGPAATTAAPISAAVPTTEAAVPEAETLLRANLIKAGVRPEFLDRAVAAAQRASSSAPAPDAPILGFLRAQQEPMNIPTLLRNPGQEPLLPQDQYATTADLRDLVQNHKEDLGPEYLTALLRELKRRALGLYPPATAP